ncbi:MAG: hypothetical protein FWD14_01955 [Treponema sp.]|nr:hypothetical protein [Treponema sp.]
MGLIRVPNPDNIPEAVTTGYQRQNTNIFVIQTGLDTTSPYENGNNIIIPAGGIIETNGVMYKIETPVTLTRNSSQINIALWIEVEASIDGSTANLILVTRPGIWNYAKNGFYRNNNRRTLNWVSTGDLASAPTIGAVYQSPTSKNIYQVSLQKGWYYARMSSGAGGGNGGNTTAVIPAAVGAGGVVSAAPEEQFVFFNINDEPIKIKIGGSGQNGQAGENSTSNQVLRGGGGAGGGGEETILELRNKLFSTKRIPGGIGGKGHSSTNPNSGGNGGCDGTPVQDGMSFFGHQSGTNYSAQGGRGGLNNGGGGGSGNLFIQNGTARDGTAGGNGGTNGWNMPNGSNGGYCNIFSITN